MKILLVEDDPLMRDSLSRLLSFLKYEIVCAPNGKTALGLMKETKFDIVITDLMMPQMSGQTLICRIKEGFSGVPVIAITGYLDEADKLKAQTFQPDYLLMKPFRIEKLVDLLERTKQKK